MTCMVCMKHYNNTQPNSIMYYISHSFPELEWNALPCYSANSPQYPYSASVPSDHAVNTHCTCNPRLGDTLAYMTAGWLAVYVVSYMDKTTFEQNIWL